MKTDLEPEEPPSYKPVLLCMLSEETNDGCRKATKEAGIPEGDHVLILRNRADLARHLNLSRGRFQLVVVGGMAHTVRPEVHNTISVARWKNRRLRTVILSPDQIKTCAPFHEAIFRAPHGPWNVLIAKVKRFLEPFCEVSAPELPVDGDVLSP